MFYSKVERLKIILDISKKLKNFKGPSGKDNDIIDLYNDQYFYYLLLSLPSGLLSYPFNIFSNSFSTQSFILSLFSTQNTFILWCSSSDIFNVFIKYILSFFFSFSTFYPYIVIIIYNV